ncbi:heat shock protein DnaJ domain protein [[Leptolyngbya] sp. PCC 7376]|uniref:J domain-containing protein n=1 Tax=[Leptolyngbya] sp. PCC 7376 TaxID=111781 RepID=UPI00029F0D08|nr:J domain-containing protein [[Leptolyngbya] sp. PCC 7376]AFY37109.1 heat shock protein DnaJ domain protein [[Leptolyngbya] sp. PCC 7376]
MNLLHCYEILGLRVDAELATIKSSYRRLARRFHPDVNAGDRQAQEKFIEINRAYRELMRTLPSAAFDEEKAEPLRVSAPYELSALEHRLKWQTYQSLQTCLRKEKFARAIALTEGLAQRLPDDVEVRQWQGIIYLSWGSLLLRKGKQSQAHTYFRKAMLADPCNLTLRQQVEQAIAKIKISAV